MRRGARARGRRGPLHLAVERYVRCPRGGLVRLDRCDACGLMQGMLIGERLEVLCGYAEPIPALRPGAERGREDVTQGSPATLAAGDGGDTALALVAPPAEGAAPSRRAATLIFETDWPDE